MIRNKAGFTLVELMVVVSIIAILATVGAVIYTGVQKNARMAKRAEDLKAVQTALELYKAANGKYPLSGSCSGIPCVCITDPCSSHTLTNTGYLAQALVPNFMPSLPSEPVSSYSNYSYRSANDGRDYKIRTSTTITEMDYNNYNSRFDLIDPARDANTTPPANCTKEAMTSLTGSKAWATYSLGGCSY